MTKYDPRKNAEGYNDPTPYAAEKHMMAQIRGKQARVAGGYFENIISASCDYYLSRGLAKIEKTPEPMKPLGAKNRKGQFLACYTKQAQPDYGGTLKGGRSIYFEAKHTDDERIEQRRRLKSRTRQSTASSWPERRKHMNQTTKETRRRSYDAVLPKRAARCRLILETLGNRELTASEITEELVAAGRIPYFNRNYVAPRLTELKEIGILTTVGRRKATRSDATEAVWARAEPSGPTGQTAAAYADNPTEAEQMTLGSAT